jgi:predicted hydrocarbon binding protein
MEQTSIHTLCFTNSFGRSSLEGIEEVLGKNGMAVVLKRAGLDQFVENYPPDDNSQEFPFSNLVSTLLAIEDIYGVRGGRVMELRVGRGAARHMLEHLHGEDIFSNPSFLALPMEKRIGLVMQDIARGAVTVGDTWATFEEREDEFAVLYHQCGVCWEQKSDQPDCNVLTGLISYILKLIPDIGNIPVTETHCIAMGDSCCEFVVPKHYEG